MRARRITALAVSAAVAVAVAACGGDDDDSADTGAPSDDTSDTADTGAPPDSAGGGGAEASLAGVCPDPIVLLTDWHPEAEHGFVYELIGDDYEIDPGVLSVRGPLVDSEGNEKGVDFEVRSGGPAIGNQNPTSLMYIEDDILLAFVYTDEAVQLASKNPTVAIESGFEKNPQMIMWDPETYPDVKDIADLGEQDVTVRYFDGAAYMEYFLQNDILSADQVDGSYTGAPGPFIADEGKTAQQGYGSAEPYKYEHEFEDWGKPVEYQYVNDAGWENYAESIATKPENIEEYRECFTELVPMIQQASVDYVNDPAETNALILDAVETFANEWTYTEGNADYAVETMKQDGLIGNGPDKTVGNFDMQRVEELIEKARPVYAELGQEPPAGLTAEDIVTNEFIDPSIGL